MLIALTGCYCRTPSADLLNITGTLDIVSKLEVDVNLNKEERSEAYEWILSEQGYNDQYEVLDDCRTKELLWFYTD